MKSWKIAAVAVLGGLMVHAPMAFADLKSVLTVVCDAHDDTLVSAAGPTPSAGPDGKPFAFCAAPPQNNCRSVMVCMDQAGWHVMQDARYPGAWSEGPGLGGEFPAAEAFYKIIFQKD
jgi:hypothetical protein